MSLTGDLCWSRTLPGRAPSHIAFADERIACSYIDNQLGLGFPGPHTLVCLDGQGQVLWSARDLRLKLVLGDGRFLGVSYEKQLRVVDRDGRDAEGIRDGDRIVACGKVAEITATRDRVLIRNEHELFVTDRALNLVERLALRPDGFGVFVGDGLMYRQGDQLVFSNRTGHTRVVGSIPVELAYDAMDRWESETGTPALAGWITVQAEPGGDLSPKLVEAAKDPSKGIRQRLGGRLGHFGWGLGYLEAMGALFLVNWAVPPHLVMCLGRDGDPRWCTYLSSGCCGGLPAALPDGRLVVSSGCGGIVSWLDAGGSVVGRRRPNEGVGLASACGSVMRALAGSGCIVEGAQAVIAYGADCELRWRSRDGFSAYDYDERHNLLVTAAWLNDRSQDSWKSVTIECVKNLGPQPAMA